MRLKCLFRRHRWHNGWDEYEHQTVWTCKRCGKERREPVSYGRPRDQAHLPPGMAAMVASAAVTSAVVVTAVCEAGRVQPHHPTQY